MLFDRNMQTLTHAVEQQNPGERKPNRSKIDKSNKLKIYHVKKRCSGETCS